jgi:virulence-associated protein VagC
MLTFHMANIPAVRIPKDLMINRDSVLLHAKSITINIHMINEFNNSLKDNDLLNKLQIKSSLFERMNPRCFINMFPSSGGCVED